MLFNLISLDTQTFNSRPLQVLFPPSNCKSITQHLYAGFLVKNQLFLHRIRNLKVGKFQRKRLIEIFCLYSNSLFTKTTGSISSIRVSFNKIVVVESISKGKVSICFPCMSILAVRNLQKALLSFCWLNFQTWFSQPLKTQIPPWRAQYKT